MQYIEITTTLQRPIKQLKSKASTQQATLINHKTKTSKITPKQLTQKKHQSTNKQQSSVTKVPKQHNLESKTKLTNIQHYIQNKHTQTHPKRNTQIHQHQATTSKFTIQTRQHNKTQK